MELLKENKLLEKRNPTSSCGSQLGEPAVRLACVKSTVVQFVYTKLTPN